MPTKAAAFFLFDALHLSRQGCPTNRASLWLLVGAWRMQTVCLSGQHSHELLANKGCRLPLCFALEPSGISDQTSMLVAALRIEQACGCESVRSPCKLFACLAGTRRSCLSTKAAAFFLFALHLSHHGSPTNRPSLWLLVGAWRMQTVCLSDQHSQELLVNKGCRLPLCFALEPSWLSDKSSKLVAALRFEQA